MEEKYTYGIAHPYPAESVLSSTANHEPDIKSAEITYSLNNTSSSHNFFNAEPDKDTEGMKCFLGYSSSASNIFKQEDMKIII